MVFYNEKKQLYLEIDALGIGIGTSLLQVKDEMQFPMDKVPNNVLLWPLHLQVKA